MGADKASRIFEDRTGNNYVLRQLASTVELDKLEKAIDAVSERATAAQATKQGAAS